MKKNKDVSTQDPSQKTEDFIAKVSQAFNREMVEAKALETGFVERESKLTGHLFLTVFTFGFSLYGTPTLTDLIGLLKLLVPKLDITPQGLHNRIDEEAVKFFEAMLGQALKLTIPKGLHLQVLHMVKRVLIFDSTSFQLPDAVAEYFRGCGGNASKAGIKILFGYDLLSGEFFYLLQEGVTPDNLKKSGMLEHTRPQDLVVTDLGFFYVDMFIELAEKGIYYLSRLHSGIHVYQMNEQGELEIFDLCAFVKKLKAPQTEIEVYLKKDGRHTKVRLFIEKAPDDVKNQRLRKINQYNQKKGHKTRQATKTLAGFSLFITNAPVDVLPTNYVRTLYRIRWQIELVFKNWKSNFKLAKITGRKLPRIKCLIYAKLLFIFITDQMIHLAKTEVLLETKSESEVSPFKASKHFKMTGFLWLMAIIQNPKNVEEILQNAQQFIKKRCLKNKSKKRVYPFQLLEKIKLATLA